MLSRLSENPGLVESELSSLANVIITLNSPPPDAKDFDTLVQSGETALMARHCLPLIKDRATGLFWLLRAWKHFLALPSPDLALAALKTAPFTAATEILEKRLLAEASMLHLGPEESLSHLDQLMDTAFKPWALMMATQAMILLKNTEKAIGHLCSFINMWPYLVNPVLKLYALSGPQIADCSPEKDEVAVLLYSWNKADLMLSTLSGLAESDIGGAKIFALDNGSTDHMQEVLEQAETIFAPGVFNHLKLPINVGAPSARNWLLSLPEVKKADWAAFLDDDVELPENWLAQLLGAAKSQGSNIAGLKITSASAPAYIQSADYQMMHPVPGNEIVNGVAQSVAVFDNCAGQPDFGFFDYTRPCLSVSGCCHILSRKSLDAINGFDIRYSPTQFDDLDRDIRAGLDGQKVVYHGQAGIRHVQFSSLAKAQTLSQAGGVMGNQIKLNAKFTDKETAGLAVKNMKVLWDDLFEKLNYLAG